MNSDAGCHSLGAEQQDVAFQITCRYLVEASIVVHPWKTVKPEGHDLPMVATGLIFRVVKLRNWMR
jgi:hypothetical protein